uniref:MLP-like protein 34 n=1 Tax=Cicer arietinum TaxID=3827 RepID=A0A1S2Y2E4_CICAR|nr:MLP-like protein 34 [Cicer arietinum]
MTLSGKVEGEVEIEAPAAKFYNIFRKQLHHIPNIATDVVHGAELHEGDWENVGSIKQWNYTIGGIKQSAKTKIETIDDDNMVLTYSIFDGEMSESYKSLKITLQVIGKEHGGLVKWTYEYEKLKEDITGAPPESYLEFAVKITKDIDAHLVKEYLRYNIIQYLYISRNIRDMTLSGKVEGEVEIEAPAAKFYNIFRKQLHHIPNIASDSVHGAKVHEGDWENVGSIKQWDFTIEGTKLSAKEKIESIDDDNKVITYSIFDGDVSENYKSFKGTLQVVDKEHGGIVKWTFEYEKLKEDIIGASPESYLDFAVKVTKDIDAHLVKE